MSSLSQPIVQGFFDPATHTVSYVVHDPATRQAAVLDPVLDYSPNSARTSTTSVARLLDYIADHDLELRYIIDTHAHAEHLSGAHYLKQQTGAPVVMSAHIERVQQVFKPLFGADDVAPDGSAFDMLVRDGDTLPLGELHIKAMHTPGHTPACFSYIVGDAVFVGDTIFQPDYGTARADFPGGDAATLYRSIQKILALPYTMRVFTGHDYLPAGRSEHAWESTITEQRAHNVHVHDGISEADFVAMRTARDKGLDAPTLILPSLQVNIRGGALPPAEENGTVYLRIPVNAI